MVYTSNTVAVAVVGTVLEPVSVMPTMGPEGCASWHWAAKATELNQHTTRMKIRGSVVS